MSDPHPQARTMKAIASRAALVASSIAAAVSAVGCGIRDPTLTNRSGSASRATTSAAPVPATATTGAATAAAPVATSPLSVLDRFALSYGDVSAATAVERDRRLAALATPAYAVALTNDEPRAALEAARGLPAGGRMVAQLVSAHLSAARTDQARGSVVLQQTVRLTNGAAEPAVDITYRAELTHTPSGWRVAAFEAAP